MNKDINFENSPGNLDITESITDLSKIKKYSDESIVLLNKYLALYDKKIDVEKKLEKLYEDYIKGFFGSISYARTVEILLDGKDKDVFFIELINELHTILHNLEIVNSYIFKGIYSYSPVITIKTETIRMNSDVSIERTTVRATPEKINELRKSKKISKEFSKENWSDTADGFKSIQSAQSNNKNLLSFNDSRKNSGKDSIFTDDEIKHAKSTINLFEILKSLFGKKEKSIFDKKRAKFVRPVMFDKFVNKHKKTDYILSQKTVLSDRFKQLRKIRFSVKDDKKYDLGLLSEQVKSDLFTTEKNKNEKSTFSYNVSSFGALSNVLVKDTSLELINSFPDFFKQLYNSLRLANIPILSNTYTNMMVLSGVISFCVGLVVSFFISLMLTSSVATSLINGLFFSILSSAITIVSFVSYPQYKIKKREQDIMTNLPFAIDHMSAIISSGVSPAAMFKLIVSSKEYGEISKELEKIVEFIDLFGYDLVTAINSVAQLSPSDDLKEFFEGFISTIESGGDLKKYLREKADSMMVMYKLERQKYTEVISTFSDVYTGIMVASPLFFVAALSLISILGGGVGGVDVNLIVILGTYVAIPLLNILFMIFIELTQPNI